MEPSNGHEVLDRHQLHDVTLGDEELMREVLSVLLDDTASQMLLLDASIRAEDRQATIRLAHYSKGACANLGAKAAAAELLQIERSAVAGDFQSCTASLAALAGQMDLLREAVFSR